MVHVFIFTKAHLKYHTDREANPGTHGASDGGNERGERVARRLRDRFHIQRHEIDLKSVRMEFPLISSSVL